MQVRNGDELNEWAEAWRVRWDKIVRALHLDESQRVWRLRCLHMYTLICHRSSPLL